MKANSILRSIHGARARAGMDEETFRDWLQRETGERHLTALDGGQHQRVLKILNGGTPGRTKSLDGSYAKKLQALWLSGWNLGVVKDKSDEALLAFVERQTGIARTEFLRAHEDAEKAVEALKKWLARDANVDWSTSGHKSAYRFNPRFQIVLAQCVKLIEMGGLDTTQAPIDAVRAAVGEKDLDQVRPKRWIEAQTELGQLIRGER